MSNLGSATIAGVRPHDVLMDYGSLSFSIFSQKSHSTPPGFELTFDLDHPDVSKTPYPLGHRGMSTC